MDNRRFNCNGEDISGIKIRLISSDYGYVDDDNIPHIKWGEETEQCDKDGFDKRHRPIEGEEVYLVEDFIIPNGTIICRYHNNFGRFTTLKGTEYELLSLPYVKETVEYHEYIVTQDLSVSCYVTKGIVAPKFNSKGGAIQFMHKQSIKLEFDDGYLQEDISWRLQNT